MLSLSRCAVKPATWPNLKLAQSERTGIVNPLKCARSTGMVFVLNFLDVLDVLFGSSDVAHASKVVCGTSLGKATGASHEPQRMAQ